MHRTWKGYDASFMLIKIQYTVFKKLNNKINYNENETVRYFLVTNWFDFGPFSRTFLYHFSIPRLFHVFAFSRWLAPLNYRNVILCSSTFNNQLFVIITECLREAKWQHTDQRVPVSSVDFCIRPSNANCFQTVRTGPLTSTVHHTQDHQRVSNSCNDTT